MRKLLTIIFFLAILPEVSIACSCSMGEVKDKLKSSKVIGYGTVVKVEDLKKENAFGDAKILVDIKFEKVFKGNSNIIQLDTAYNGMGCTGYWFKEHNKYLIYAFKRKGKYNVMWCGGVISEEDSGDTLIQEIEELEKLTKR